jgi:hypothetical protein
VLYRTEAPVRIGHALLLQAVAYRLQERVLGGLKPSVAIKPGALSDAESPIQRRRLYAMKMRYFAPLIGFVVPTIVIGFGLMIPRSCIAGFNDLTVGFSKHDRGCVCDLLVGSSHRAGR